MEESCERFGKDIGLWLWQHPRPAVSMDLQIAPPTGIDWAKGRWGYWLSFLWSLKSLLSIEDHTAILCNCPTNSISTLFLFSFILLSLVFLLLLMHFSWGPLLGVLQPEMHQCIFYRLVKSGFEKMSHKSFLIASVSEEEVHSSLPWTKLLPIWSTLGQECFSEDVLPLN